ncbi:DNA translocase FtsK [Mycoplasmatota bacterium zrk1]
MFKKKEKKHKTEAIKTPFTIPEIKGKTKKNNYNSFVSPYFGDNVKDELIVPKSTLKGDINERFDVFRSERKIKEEKKYKEFNILSSDDVRQMLNKKGRNDSVSTERFQKLEEKTEEEEVSISIPFGLRDELDEENKENEEIKSKEDVYEHIELDENIPPEEKEEAVPDDILNFLFGEEETEVSSTQKVSNEVKKETTNIEDSESDSTFRNKHAYQNYQNPSLDLLKYHDDNGEDDAEYLYEQEQIINNTLEQFRVGGRVVNYTHGPTVTQYEVKLDSGVIISKLTNIASNLKMNLAAIDIRIEAPIPGKTTIGIEVPNKVKKLVNFGNYITKEFIENSKPLEVTLGVDLGGNVINADICKMPHGLIAGATGSGKSVCIDTILMSLLLKANPKDLRLILIDPKRVGLAAYSKIPHLASPIIHDSKVAAQCLKWAVDEMERRYNLLFSVEARDLDSYNKKIKERTNEGFEHLPNIVIVIEEMADLMSQASSDVEQFVMRIAQKARAAGIYMLIATQRPSVDVIKGSIKSNIPTRIALKVASNTDSMTIIDFGGAESLLGNGDMLFSFAGLPLKRLQGAFVSDDEIDSVTKYLGQYDKDYLFTTDSLLVEVEKSNRNNNLDDIFVDVAKYCIENNYASINKVQREFNIGYNRASEIFAQLEENGIVTSPNSKNPRKVIIDMDTFHDRFGD